MIFGAQIKKKLENSYRIKCKNRKMKESQKSKERFKNVKKTSRNIGIMKSKT